MGVSGDLRGPQCEFRAIFSDDAAAAVACEPWAAAEAPCAEVAAGRRAWEAAAGVACAPWEEEGVACAPRAAEAAALCAAAEVVVPCAEEEEAPCGLWGAAAEDRVAAAGRQTPEPRGAARVLRRPGSL